MSPYLQLIRFDKPTGTWLVLWPSLWSITIATPLGLPELSTLILFALGAFLMRSAGCIINDIIDRDIDRQVTRTRKRPLASGRVSVNEAWAILIFLLLMALCILLQFNRLTVMLGFAIVLPIAVYPLMKRIFPWPQLFLGVVFNWGVLMGEAAVADEVSLSGLLLYVACIFWTLGYDTVYAHQDKEDDLQLGIHSTALSFGRKSRYYIGIFYGVMTAFLLAVGIVNGFSAIFYAGIFLAGLHLFLQVRTLDINNAENCMNKFTSNISLGWIIFLTLVIEKGMQF